MSNSNIFEGFTCKNKTNGIDILWLFFRKNGGKDEVVVYGEQSLEKPSEVVRPEKSVKAQIHSLETRGRYHRVIPTTENQSLEKSQSKSAGVNGSTFTKNPRNR